MGSKLKGVKVEAEGLDAVANRLKILDKEFLKGPSFSQSLYAVTEALPAAVQLTLVDFQDDGKFSLKGYSDDMASVFAIVKSLNGSGSFSEVKIKYASQLKRKSVIRVEFLIQGRRK